MRKPILLLSGFLLLTLLIAACSNSGIRKDSPALALVGNDAYLKVNVWYEHPLKILSTNYHKGIMLKVGDKFKIIDVSGKKIIFSDENGIEYAIIYNRGHTLVSMADLLSRTFSKTSVLEPGGAFSKFSEMEQQNIRQGKVVIGMSKNAVVMAFGYPPEHRTSTRAADAWTYWRNRFVTNNVTFEEDRVVSFR
ncbi:MAG: hypothetical protein GXP14_00830 [Gammaproteobacteria bacterium]|nr:hypothetical protein [Gammaproteobacteria bacterium]